MIRVNWIFARPVGDFWVIGPRSIRVIAFRKSDLLESDLLFNTINHLQVACNYFILSIVLNFGLPMWGRISSLQYQTDESAFEDTVDRSGRHYSAASTLRRSARTNTGMMKINFR
jgi:hypothetical protein